jgi:hypothetical protein
VYINRKSFITTVESCFSRNTKPCAARVVSISMHLLKSGLAQSLRRNWQIPCLFGVWGLMIILVRPYGEFPLNDDWAYSLPVKWYLETGQLHLTFWQFMTLVTQIVLGVAWTALVGFSLEHLRILVILLTFLFLWAAYALSREAGLSKAISFFHSSHFSVFSDIPGPGDELYDRCPLSRLGNGILLFSTRSDES